MTYYYADAQNQTHGPCTREELEQLARRGVLTARSRVIEHGGQTWSTWAAIEASFAPPAAAAPPLARAEVAPPETRYPVSASRELISASAVLYGLLLVLIQYFILPYTLLVQALRDLSLWGRQHALPTTQSDTPVLTFVTVVLRPPTHVTITLGITALAVLELLDGIRFLLTSNSFFLFGQSRFELFLSLIGNLLGTVALAYLSNLFIAFFFEISAFFILLANNVRRIAEKD